MERKMFLNVAVADLDRSVQFFTRLGFSFDPNVTDEKATCMNVGEDSYVMLLVRDFFSTFTTRQLVDPTASTEAIVAIAVEDRAAVDSLADTAFAAGAGRSNEAQDHGFMYQRSFADLDGHLWEVFWMDPAGIPGQPVREAATA